MVYSFMFSYFSLKGFRGALIWKPAWPRVFFYIILAISTGLSVASSRRNNLEAELTQPGSGRGLSGWFLVGNEGMRYPI